MKSILGLTVMSLNQSDPALTVRGHGLPEEEPVQADGGTGRSSGDRHCGREHPHPAGQGQENGDCTHSKAEQRVVTLQRFQAPLKVWFRFSKGGGTRQDSDSESGL